jgi:GNAT superfamily N-acetyltransferase
MMKRNDRLKIMIIDVPRDIDLSLLLGIFNNASLSTEGFPEEKASLAKFMNMVNGEVILVASIDDQIAGFASVWEQGNFIHHLYIDPKFQNLGIGPALLRECQTKCGLPLYLKCIEQNKGACRFLEKKWLGNRRESYWI